MTTPPRRPASFPITAEPEHPVHLDAAPRRPRAISDPSSVREAEHDIFDEPDLVTAPPPPATAKRRRSPLTAIFLSAFGAFVSLALGLWAESIISDLFARTEWLGWLAAGLAGIAALALLAILLREFIALRRLKSMEVFRSRGTAVIANNDTKGARALVQDLSSFLSAKPETAAGRRMLSDLHDDVIDGADLMRLAETELLTPLDQRAQIMILDAAKRVSLVTAVSPRALVDLAYVIFEAGRLIRRIADLYGGRPGTLGFIRIARDVLAHLAVTGTVAFGDSLVHQLVGQGLAARLSARLGEGVVNGMMTARIGLAAMETARPLPFNAVRRPGISDFLAALSTFARARRSEQDGDRT
ncbi:TIGR01620 family protein [Tianweitania sp. BSSL-BM11]|uniref:TIGR01620 family protein n=1 Tax=Tianweitania aestuarii TaxID=2814886 RepID=A0ABS5RUH2_9HYPH|nr:TIGR01620 family protein [Tianweitania aestuarii]MBS9720715.1 TIGR01620 family protein [Tianweitania aestuarii]